MKVYRVGRMGRRLAKVDDGWLTQLFNYVTGTDPRGLLGGRDGTRHVPQIDVKGSFRASDIELRLWEDIIRLEGLIFVMIPSHRAGL